MAAPVLSQPQRISRTRFRQRPDRGKAVRPTDWPTCRRGLAYLRLVRQPLIRRGRLAVGHVRLGVLPASRKWRQVVEELRLDAVAAATAGAAEAALHGASRDPA